MIEYFDNGDVAVFDGYTFRRDKKTGYFLSAKKIRDGHRCRLHVYVWEKVNGKRVPEGCEVHHVDGDKMHNEPENLNCISAEEHRKIHSENIPAELIEKWRKNLIEKAVPASKAWHRSEEGRKWHSITSAESYKKRELREYVCTYCGSSFKTKNIYGEGKNCFCSNKCKSAYRRMMGYDNVETVCQKCGKVFMSNKYAKRKFCDNCKSKKSAENLTGLTGL